MKLIILSLVFLSAPVLLSAQDIYYTKSGQVSFSSKAALENIEAHNNEVTSFIDVKKNEIAFSVLIKSFRFEKALMEEHFNASYMESDKYPKAVFMGKVTDLGKLKLDVNGSYEITVEGTLTIHGVSNPIKTKATVVVQNEKLSGNAKFNIQLADYKVKIPSVVSQNIAEIVEVSINCQYSPLESK